MLYELYLITNTINNKKYVGQTKESIGFRKRFEQHLKDTKYSKHCSILHLAIKKYGSDKFVIKRLLHGIEESKIDYYERLWVEKLGTYYKLGNGYNMTLGGQGIHGYRHSERTLLIISEKSKNNWEVIKKDKDRLDKISKRMSIRMSGVPKSTIAREHLSVSAKRRFENEQGTFTGRKHTKETKDLISLKNGVPVMMYDTHTGKPIEYFQSAHEARRYLIRQGITKNKTAETRIFTVCDTECTAYGYRWKRVEKV